MNPGPPTPREAARQLWPGTFLEDAEHPPRVVVAAPGRRGTREALRSRGLWLRVLELGPGMRWTHTEETWPTGTAGWEAVERVITEARRRGHRWYAPHLGALLLGADLPELRDMRGRRYPPSAEGLAALVDAGVIREPAASSDGGAMLTRYRHRVRRFTESFGGPPLFGRLT